MAEKKQKAAGPKENRRLLRDHEMEILKYRSQGKGLDEIAELTGFARITIYRYLKKKNLNPTSRCGGNYTRKDHILTYAVPRKPKHEHIIENGKTYRDVTEEYAGW